MRAVIRRVRRLEDRFKPAGGPRRFRVVVRLAGCEAEIPGATCQRTLYPYGTLMELICPGPGAPENVEHKSLEEWIDSFPVRIVGGAA